MGMSKMATGNIKIFISRLNDFEIAQETDCYNVQIVEHGQKIDEGKKKRRKTREAISCPESSGYFGQRDNATDCWRREKGERTSLAFAPVSPPFASTRSSPSEHRATATVHCYSD